MFMCYFISKIEVNRNLVKIKGNRVPPKHLNTEMWPNTQLYFLVSKIIPLSH